MKAKLFFLSLLCGGLLAGCASFFENPYFTVEESGLNWVVIRYYNYQKKPVQRVNLRLDGNGIVSVKSGTSSLVANSFAANMEEDSSWGDIQEKRVTIPRKEMVPLFQMLVDNGLFVERSSSEAGSTNEAFFVFANIQNKTCGSGDDNILVSDPDLAEHLRTILMMFYHPQPKPKPRKR
ncbi:MAG: hypothetical protein J6334_13165 [Kiritimatiellae bacterium]|nr:hypothetical protein [Kiritimatiellia bacterium]